MLPQEDYSLADLPGFDYLEDKPPRLRTDPLLPVIPMDAKTSEQTELFQEYKIVEPTLTISQKMQLVRVLQSAEPILSRSPYDIGLYNGGTHHIGVSDMKPIYTIPRRMSHAKLEYLREDINLMLAAGILRRSSSPWCSPVLYVMKDDNPKSRRLVIDYRDLNKVAISCAYPLPRISTLLSAFEGMCYFTSIDLVKGFWQIGLDEESMKYTAITTLLGLYEFTRIPFGINSGPAKFQSIMMYELRGLEANVMVYIDDVLIFTPTFEKHVSVVKEVLDRLGKANLKVSLKKCEFARTELVYLV